MPYVLKRSYDVHNKLKRTGLVVSLLVSEDRTDVLQILFRAYQQHPMYHLLLMLILSIKMGKVSVTISRAVQKNPQKYRDNLRVPQGEMEVLLN